MSTESELRKENIAEYLLYMWQMEDLARAFQLDSERMIQACLGSASTPGQRNRLEEICQMMRLEGLREKGHLQVNRNILLDLEDLSSLLLSQGHFPDYALAYSKALPDIRLLQQKAGALRKGELETCFDALYGELMLRLEKRQASCQTQEALDGIRRLIALLASYYIPYKEDRLKTMES